MKKHIILLLLVSIPFFVQAQLGKRIKRAAKQTTENKAAQKTGEVVNKGLDESIDAVGGLFKKKKTETSDQEEQETALNNKNPGETEFGVFRNFTFIPGNKVIFHDDFAKDPSGDFPANWGTGGSGEVVSLSNDASKWLSIQRRSGYLPTTPAELPENYTIEFDLTTNGYGEGKPSSKVYLSFLPKKAYSMGQAGSVADIELLLHRYFRVARVENFGSEAKMTIGNNMDRDFPEYLNTKVHISIAVNKQRLRFWVNEEKLVDAPSILQGKLGRYFLIEARDILPEKGHFAGITNFRIAESEEDMRSKLLKDGKFSTSGILFNSNAAVVKKESYGILKSIADMMKSDENLKLNIVGHTDDVGQEAFNQELSLKRAEAVKNILIKEFLIDANRLKFSGKGETEPIEKNNTERGKANNRRVEFIKI